MKIKKFKVEVCRTGFSFTTIEVEAKNKKEAKKQAVEQAGDHEFSEKDANYSIVYVSEE